jgi:hypothetical protein
LAAVLVAEFGGFEVEDDKALEEIVVEDEIEVEVARFGADPHLAGEEGKAVPHFEQESLELGDDG